MSGVSRAPGGKVKITCGSAPQLLSHGLVQDDDRHVDGQVKMSPVGPLRAHLAGIGARDLL